MRYRTSASPLGCDIDEIQLLLFGFEAEPGQRQALLDLAAELCIAEQVEVPGPTTGAETERSLRGAQCFCLPS
jgi:hypothetical protein